MTTPVASKSPPTMPAPENVTIQEVPYIKVFDTIAYVDSTYVKNIDVDALPEAVENINKKKEEGLEIQYLNSFKDYTNLNMAMSYFTADVNKLQILSKFCDITLPDDTLKIINNYNKLSKNIADKIAEIKKNTVPEYPWVVNDIVFADYFTLLRNGASIRRSTGKSANGNWLNTDYSVTLKWLERVWQFAAKEWKKPKFNANGSVTSTTYMKTNGYDNRPVVTVDQVQYGCQRITRQELEAVARHYNWEIPA